MGYAFVLSLPMTSPQGIPPARADDTEDVAWALQTAETLWKRDERVDAVVWLRRAATSAGEAEADDRALELARAAAELSEWMAQNPLVPHSNAPSAPPGDHGGVDDLLGGGHSEPPADAGVDDLLGVEVEVDVDESPTVQVPSSMQPEVFRSVMEEKPPADVPSAAEAHAGMLDPWAHEAAKEAPPAAPVVDMPPPLDSPYDDEVITSAKLVTLAAAAHASTRKPQVADAPPSKPRQSRPPKPAKPTKPGKPPPPVPKKPPPMRQMAVTSPEVPSARPPPPIADEAEDATRSDIRSPLVDLPLVTEKPEPTLVSASGTEARPPDRTHPVVDVSGDDFATSVRVEMPVIPGVTIPQPSAPVVDIIPPPELPTVEAPVAEVPPEAIAPPLPELELPTVEAPVAEAPAPALEPEPAPAPEPAAGAVSLATVDALTDLPDDARAELERVAVVHRLARDEEVMGFGLAYVIEGAVDIAAQISDSPAEQLSAGTVLKAKGSLAESTPLRLVGAAELAVVATWTPEQVEPAFKACPWVEDELRERANHVQALVGVTLGPLADHLDVELRRQVTSRLTLREIEEGGVVMEGGAPVKELCIVGQGSLELVKDGEVVGTVNVGEVLYPQEIMGGGKATATVRAAKGGALILAADRGVAQELMMTCPPLLEIFSSM